MKKPLVKALLSKYAEGVYVLETHIAKGSLGVIYKEKHSGLFVAHIIAFKDPFYNKSLADLVRHLRARLKEHYDFRLLNFEHYASGLQDNPPDIVRNDFIDPKDAQRAKVKVYERRREMRRLSGSSEPSANRGTGETT